MYGETPYQVYQLLTYNTLTCYETKEYRHRRDKSHPHYSHDIDSYRELRQRIPQLKAGILSFMMPTFLIITGYLVNIEKSPKEMGRYLMCLALPYVIMVTGFSVLSYFMPVRDGITELSLLSDL